MIAGRLEQGPAALAVAGRSDGIALGQDALAQGQGAQAGLGIDGFDVIAVIDQHQSTARQPAIRNLGDEVGAAGRLSALFDHRLSSAGAEQKGTEQQANSRIHASTCRKDRSSITPAS